MMAQSKINDESVRENIQEFAVGYKKMRNPSQNRIFIVTLI